jgi:aminoglycoside 6-adenylyltransferase
MRSPDEFVAQVQTWARGRSDVQAAILIGSTARAVSPADRWSDVDVALFVDDPAVLLVDSEWLAQLGDTLLTFVETTATGGASERRVLFTDGIEADFACFPAAHATSLARDAVAAATIRRGYRVLVDRIGLSTVLAATEDVRKNVEDAARLEALANDIWYHALWAAKKARRGELWVARSCVDCYIHARLVEALRLRATVLDPSVDTWHDGRFLEQWAPADVVEALWASLVREPDDLGPAILRSVDLFERVADELAEHFHVTRTVTCDRVRADLEALLADPAT